MDVKRIEQAAEVLRPYGITQADAMRLAQFMVDAVGDSTPVPIKAEDVAALMRPRRQAPVPDPETPTRRQRLRSSIQVQPGTVAVHHHRDDYDAAVSHVRYICRREGWTCTRERVSADQTVFQVLSL